MYYQCIRCNITIEESNLSFIREWHSECERDCYEDFTNYGCPECGREMREGYLCDCCGNFVPSHKVEYIGFDTVCPDCYTPDEEEEERPNLIEIMRRRLRYGEPLRIDERAFEPA